MIKMGRIVDTIGPAGNGIFGAQIVKVALQDPPIEVTAYAKPLDRIPFLVEILCARLADAMGLPVPEPIIAFSEDGERQFFASLKVDYPDLTQRLTISNDQIQQTSHNVEILRKISEWPSIEKAAAFDEWIANEDRNLGNLLFDGDKAITLIDHNLAMRPHFVPNNPLAKNTLLDIKLEFNQDEFSKQRIKTNLSHLISQLDGTLPKKITDQMRDDLNLATSLEIDHMLNFLDKRLTVLGNITTSRVPVKQMSL